MQTKAEIKSEIKDVYCSSIDYRSKANKQSLHKWLVSSCISATFLPRSCSFLMLYTGWFLASRASFWYLSHVWYRLPCPYHHWFFIVIVIQRILPFSVTIMRKLMIYVNISNIFPFRWCNKSSLKYTDYDGVFYHFIACGFDFNCASKSENLWKVIFCGISTLYCYHYLSRCDGSQIYKDYSCFLLVSWRAGRAVSTLHLQS
jgi:hypothetical protein